MVDESDHIVTFTHVRFHRNVIRVICRCGAEVIAGGDDAADAERIAGSWTRHHRTVSA